jgi:hypothetical protein
MLTRLIRWLDRRLDAGIYRGPIKAFVAWCDAHLSLNNHVKRGIRRALGYHDEQKTPAWVSEAGGAEP